MPTPSVEQQIMADVDGAVTGDAGEVRWTGNTTSEKSAPATSAMLDLAGRQHYTFKNFVFVGGNPSTAGQASVVEAGTTLLSSDIKFLDCTFIPGSDATKDMVRFIGATTGGSPNSGRAINLTFDRCRFLRAINNAIHITIPKADSAYNANVLIQNCLFLGGGESEISAGHACILVDSSGALAQFGGGVTVVNNTAVGSGSFIKTNGVDTTTFQLQSYANACIGCDIRATTLGEIIENWSVIYSDTAITNVSAGLNTVTDGSHSFLFHIGQELAQGKYGRPVMTPTADSPFLGKGGISTPTYDLLNAPRPAGSAQWTNNSPAIGCMEFGNSGIKETTTFNSSPTSMKIAGPGWHDFDFPVDAVATTINVYVRYDGSYTGATKPQMQVLNGTECGVSNQTVASPAAANTWQQISLTFTPTSKGIVTIRLISNDTSGAGNTYWDDFSTS